MNVHKGQIYTVTECTTIYYGKMQIKDYMGNQNEHVQYIHRIVCQRIQYGIFLKFKLCTYSNTV